MESHTRTIARAASWRVTATAVTAVFTGLEGAIVINIAMTIFHYIHERIWLKFSWGKLKEAH
jgi:uncharacterized membrane protein